MTEQAALAAAVCLVVGFAVGIFLTRRRSNQSPAVSEDQIQREGIALSLQMLSERIDRIGTLHAADQSQVIEQLRTLAMSNAELQQSTGSLSRALSNATYRGRWGEMQLRRIVEAAGLTRGIDFAEQVTVQSDDGSLRPDMVITLTDDRTIVVDAKVPLESILECSQAGIAYDDTQMAARHAQALAGHIDLLASKNYWRQFNRSPAFVVLFLPAESLLGLALSFDPGLLDRAFARNVVIATPSTLLALLRTVALGWHDRDVSENAEQIRALAGELYDRLATMTSHLNRVGVALDATVGNYNKLVGSYESRVLVSSRRIVELGVGSEQLTSPPHVDQCARRVVSAPGSFTHTDD